MYDDMRRYLTNEPDLAPFKEMILHKNAEWLWGISGLKPAKDSHYDKMIVRIAEMEVYPEYLDEIPLICQRCRPAVDGT